MANPSLQIGNDNWAIKEDNLLGYSTAGTRFLPQPITMTRATLGTRVNPSGLVENVELLGSELITNGDFANGTSGWTTSGGWSITDKATNSGSGGQIYPVSNSWTSGVTVRFSLTVSNRTTGHIRIQNPSVSVYYQNNINTNDSFIFEFTTVDSAGWKIEAVSGFDGDIDNISAQVFTQNNLARVDYTDGTSSLLVEPQRTNTITYSEDFSQSSWFKTSGVTLTSNYGVSPDGNNNSTRLQLSTNNEQIYDSIIHSGNTETASIYVKGTSGETIQFGVGNNISQGGTYTLNGEWQRINQQSTSGSVVIIGNKDSTATDFEIWAGQFEIGSYPTSYIKTSGGTVTRVQETYEKTGISDLINSEEGVLFVEMAALSDDVTERYISLSDGSLSNRVYIQFTTTTNQIKMGVTKGGSTQASRPETVSDVTEFNKLAISYSQDLFKFYVNGSLVFTDSSGDTFTANTLNRLNFDVGTSGFSKFFGKVRNLQVYKTALTEDQLEDLTS